MAKCDCGSSSCGSPKHSDWCSSIQAETGGVLFARTEGPMKLEYADVPTIREAITAGIALLKEHDTWDRGAKYELTQDQSKMVKVEPRKGYKAEAFDGIKAWLPDADPSQPRYFSIQKWYRENPVTHDFEAWPLDWPQEAFSVIGNSKSGAEVSIRAIDDLGVELAEIRARLVAEVKQEPYQRPPTTRINWAPAGGGYWGQGFGELKRYQMDIEASAAKNLMMTREQLVGDGFVKNAMNDLDSMRKAQAAAMLAADDEDDEWDDEDDE